MASILVVGAGATGACAALKLRQALGSSARIQVWEKARGAGGRMTTNRQEVGGANLRADMGAQYLSFDSADPTSAEVTEMLIAAGVCAEVPAERLAETPERPRGGFWKHLAGTAGGVNDALKKILDDAGVDVHYEKRVASLDQSDGKWRARPFEGAPGTFDAVLLAVPGRGVGGDNLSKIRGGWEGAMSGQQRQSLDAVEHDHRWAFAFYLPQACAAQCDTFFGKDAVERIVEDGTLHLLCHQSRKTAFAGRTASEGGVVVVAHTTLEWARRNSRANGRDQGLLAEVGAKVQAALGVKGDISRLAHASKVITWKQCQVTKPAPANRAEGPCMVVSSSPTLVLAGDYFTASNFGGCLQSGAAAAKAVADCLGGGSAGRAASRVIPGVAPAPDEKGRKGGNGGGKGGGNGGDTGGGKGGASGGGSLSESDKEIMKVKKKLRDIEKLKEKKTAGTLDVLQQKKLDGETELLAQLRELGGVL